MPIDKIQFRPGPLTAALEARGAADNATASQIADRDLSRYYDLLALALAQVQLSPGEASLIVDALNGTAVDLVAAQGLPYEIADSLEDGLAEKWEVDGSALITKAHGWSLLQRIAVCDAAERFWSGAAYHVENTAARLITVGLVRVLA